MTASPVRQAAILVGGLGTRLGELTAALPKPMLPCGDRPFLTWILRELTRFGIEDVLLLTGHRGDLVEAAVPQMLASLPKPLRITCVREDKPAGTGGALYHARDHFAERFLLCNGDSWLDFNLRRLLEDARHDTGRTIGRMVLRRVEDASRYGVVETQGDQVTAFRERPETAQPGVINAGIYLFDRRILDHVTPLCSLERDVLPPLAADGVLRGTVADGYFIDIGIPTDLNRAQTELPERLHRRALVLGDDFLTGADRPDVLAALRIAADAGWHVFATMVGASGFVDAMDDIEHDHPSREGLEKLLGRWELSADRCVFVGARDDNLTAAYEASVPSRLFSGGSLAEFMRRIIDSR
ncbi:MAG TPA: nucleotidyltransferase family protein [Aliidongia sp.]|uniref:nucleotidyltransferase family protein n=1 Tax=Aliidongia sp. TaxID=1914230 RepID=UPI002DDCB469|nr:nucleotidyltransferase family protein [Aliidongia sp.]HEV2673687.1 nucleotidyltransferase family protein [Aliidongia sp.]